MLPNLVPLSSSLKEICLLHTQWISKPDKTSSSSEITKADSELSTQQPNWLIALIQIWKSLFSTKAISVSWQIATVETMQVKVKSVVMRRHIKLWWLGVVNAAGIQARLTPTEWCSHTISERVPSFNNNRIRWLCSTCFVQRVLTNNWLTSDKNTERPYSKTHSCNKLMTKRRWESRNWSRRSNYWNSSKKQ